MVSTRDNSAEDSGDQVRTQSEQDAPAFAKTPWYVGGNGKDILWFDDRVDRCQLVATVASYVYSEGTVPHGPGTANLIAAAPDLFAALEALVAYVDDNPPACVRGLLNDARNAIQKAQGAQS